MSAEWRTFFISKELSMRNTLLLLVLFPLFFVQGQKIVKKSILSPAVSFVQIDAANCFKIDMETSETNEMVVKAIIDGEYKEDLILKVKEVGATLMIGAGFQPSFINPNDKLSAHKIVSISLSILLPEYRSVQVQGTRCNVNAKGIYKNLKVTLDEGKCNLFQVSEAAKIITRSGDINVASSSAAIRADSKYGVVRKEKIPAGNNQFDLKTITGNIYLRKIE